MKSRGLLMPQKAPVSSLPFTQAPTPSIPFTQASTLPVPSLPVTPSLPSTQAPTFPMPSLPVTPSLPSTQAPTLPMPSLPFTQAPTLPMPSLPVTPSLPFTQAPTLPVPSLLSTQDSTLDLETHLPPPKIPTVPSIPLKIPLPPKTPTIPSLAPKTPQKLPMPPKTSPPPMPSKKIPLPPTPKSSQSQHFPLSRTPSVTAFSLIQSTPEEEGDAPFPSPPPIPSIPPSTPSIQVAKPSIKLPPPPVIPSTVVSKPPSAPSIKLPPPPVLKPPSVPSIPLKKSQSDDELFSPISSPIGSPKGIYPLVKVPYNPISSIKDFFEDEEEKEERLRKKKEKEDKKKEEEEAEKKRKKEEEKNRLSNLYKESMDAYRREKTEKEREDEERRKILEGERQKYIISRQMHYKELSNVPWPYLLEKNKKDDSYMTEKQKEIFKVFDHVGWNMDFDSDSIMYVEERKEKSYSYKYDPYIDFMESPVEFRRAFREGKIIEEKNKGENEEGEQQWITLRLLFDGNKYVDVFWYSSKGITPEKIIDLTSEFYNTPLSYENIKNIYTDEPVSDKNDYYGKLPKNMLSKTHQTEFVGFIPLPNWVFLIKFNIL